MAKKQNKKQSGSDGGGLLMRYPMAFVIIVGVVVVFAITAAVILFSRHNGDAKWFYLPDTPTNSAVRDSLRNALGDSEGNKVYALWRLQGGEAARAHGAYRVDPGQSVVRTARRIKTGSQTPVKVSFNNLRTLDQLAERVCDVLECEPDSFMAACRDLLPQAGFGTHEFPAAFLPDTYEFYWTAGGHEIVRRLLEYRNRFWNDDRRAKAKALGLSPVQVATLASIVEEETNNTAERPMVARLYLNRLDRGMKLQADPTVKFATGDFALKRIRNGHLSVNSPFNTYLNHGLPPGPIRVSAAATIDAVLNAPHHDFLYMCAKEDFSGTHNFAENYSDHLINARRYQAALDRRNIK